MDKVTAFLSGKKTYIVAIVAAGLAFAGAMGYPVPEWVYAVLGAIGLTTIRAGVAKSGPK